jgi:hypothetical protein
MDELDSDTQEFLAHYGVPGMRWGRRKGSASSGGGKLGGGSTDAKVMANRERLVKDRRKLSDADLKKAIDRISSEKKLKELVNEDVKPGRTAAKKIMSENGKKALAVAVTGGTLLVINRTARKFVSKEAADMITKRK